MTKSDANSFRTTAEFPRLALLSGLTAVGLAAIGYWPTLAQAGAAGASAMLVAIAIALVGAWAGTLPPVVYLAKPPQQHPIGILMGLSTRFLVTMGLALGVWLTGLFPKAPLLIWVGIAQFVLLGVDVAVLVGLLRKAAKEAA